jgi:hypothetical protein
MSSSKARKRLRQNRQDAVCAVELLKNQAYNRAVFDTDVSPIADDGQGLPRGPIPAAHLGSIKSYRIYRAGVESGTPAPPAEDYRIIVDEEHALLEAAFDEARAARRRARGC